MDCAPIDVDRPHSLLIVVGQIGHSCLNGFHRHPTGTESIAHPFTLLQKQLLFGKAESESAHT